MAEAKKPTNKIVTFTDDAGNTHWASEDSKAYQQHLSAQAAKKPKAATAPANTTAPAGAAKSDAKA